MFNRGKYNLTDFDTQDAKPTEIALNDTLADALEAGASLTFAAIGSGITLDRLTQLLAATGFPVAYNHFISAPTLPFILFLRDQSANFYADNRVWQKGNRWRIYLCTALKSTAAETALESVFDAFDLPWEVIDESYVKDERLYQTIYELEEVEA